MTTDSDPVNEDDVYNAMRDLLRSVISNSLESAKADKVAAALLCFLVRNANTWRSIRTLRAHNPDAEGFLVDAGVLLRAMFDAYIQARFIVENPETKLERAQAYLDYEHVERMKLAERIIAQSNPLAEAIKSSPNREEGERRVRANYDLVKSQYLTERWANGSLKVGPGTRSKWYKEDLATLASRLGLKDEYETFVAPFHGCVHSGPMAVRFGPSISGDHVLDLASTIAGRVASLNVEHNKLQLSEFHTEILAALCKPYFDRHPPDDTTEHDGTLI